MVQPNSTQNKSHRLLVIVLIILFTLLSDQATKALAQAYLKDHFPISFLGNLFRLEYAENKGAFLSLGSQLPDSVRFWFLTAIVGISLIVALSYLLTKKTLSSLSTYGLSLIVGGGISNLIDRAFRANSSVVDFMNMGIGNLRTGIFNIADVAIMAGVGFMVWELMTQPHEK